MVKKYFLIIFLNIFLKFLAVGDLFRYSLNGYPQKRNIRKKYRFLFGISDKKQYLCEKKI